MAVSDDAHDLKIQTIVPATQPWLAVFDDDVARPVACWGLVQCAAHGKSYVAPFVSYQGEIVDATTLHGYVEAVPDEDDGMETLYDGDADDGEGLDS